MYSLLLFSALSNFQSTYRKLVRDGEIKDDNYKFDEKGKLLKPSRKPKTESPKKRKSDYLIPETNVNEWQGSF